MVSKYGQTVDILNLPSRNFYERAKVKQTIALFLAGNGMMFLGFGTTKAGQANSEAFLNNLDSAAGYEQKMADQLTAGYGFAAFVFIVASILCLAMAMYISPYSCGSTNEKKILTYPGDIYSTGSPARSDVYVQPQSI